MIEMYAIIETGGKQYKVAAGDTVTVDYLDAGQGKEIELSRVLLIADGEDTTVGNPTIDNAKVTATCLKEGRGDKVIVFKYKNKTRYHRKNGHRQLLTTLKINDIIKPGGVAEESKSTRKRKVTTGGES
jgi:large subunit ribosomal protein L21